MLSDGTLNGREIGWDFIVAVELEVVKGGGDTEPARHVGGLHAAHFCDSDGDDVAATERAADEDDFQFDCGIEFDAFGTRKKTPVELMSRVTRETGYFSTAFSTLRNRKGKCNEARGYSRCS